ncbi:hypothetical protein [Yinghuangia soli]|uniref:Uncharacterized protein n=1 Tax=Yinghuangia soli TaxID=2908204 RepID=A0AA41Q4T1_9ACTN|nr:hypothetical protein [Yinghuangia soli]MCF2530691.1 hypothetical protein [Yinghuangia soli]
MKRSEPIRLHAFKSRRRVHGAVVKIRISIERFRMAGVSVRVASGGVTWEYVDFLKLITDAMAPFQVGRAESQELGIWDSWSIEGGVDGSGIPVAAGAANASDLLNSAEFAWEHGSRSPGIVRRCAGGRRSLLDFEAVRAEAADYAGATWDLWRDLQGSMEPVPSWSSYASSREGENRQQVVDEYKSQELIKSFAARRIPREALKIFSGAFLRIGDPVEDLAVSRANFI